MSRPPTKKALTTALPLMLPHFQYRFEPYAKAINCTTLPITTSVISETSHPLHIPFQRRLDSYDRSKLCWAVRCATALSKRRTVRMWVVKRIREAFLAELKRNGFDKFGTRIDSNGLSAKSSTPSQLSGALCLISRDSALSAPIEEIRTGCKIVLKRVVKAHNQQKPSESSKSTG